VLRLHWLKDIVAAGIRARHCVCMYSHCLNVSTARIVFSRLVKMLRIDVSTPRACYNVYTLSSHTDKRAALAKIKPDTYVEVHALYTAVSNTVGMSKAV
jgi:hypothetical protein